MEKFKYFEQQEKPPVVGYVILSAFISSIMIFSTLIYIIIR
ncbi:MAG: hypothetical protein ACI9EW_001677 [Cellvibrionaceae bacterium]|jgi:hypothetical protein